MSQEIKPLEKAYALGFAASGEGYNAEHPFDSNFDGDANWLKGRDYALANLLDAPVPQDVIDLVIAAREFWDANNDLSDESRALDNALEPFASRVPYANEPDDERGEP